MSRNEKKTIIIIVLRLCPAALDRYLQSLCSNVEISIFIRGIIELYANHDAVHFVRKVTKIIWVVEILLTSVIMVVQFCDEAGESQRY